MSIDGHMICQNLYPISNDINFKETCRKYHIYIKVVRDNKENSSTNGKKLIVVKIIRFAHTWFRIQRRWNSESTTGIERNTSKANIISKNRSVISNFRNHAVIIKWQSLAAPLEKVRSSIAGMGKRFRLKAAFEISCYFSRGPHQKLIKPKVVITLYIFLPNSSKTT